MTDPWVEAAQNWYNLAYYQVVDGFTPIEVDGQTGWGTMYAFTRALQYELGISPRSDTFGPGTLTALSTFGTVNSSNPPASGKTNVIRIAQAALYCKGYNPGNGAITGVWDTATQNAVKAMRSDLGLGATSSDLTPKLFKFLLTMDAAKLLPGGDSVVRQGQQAMNARYLSRRDFYAVPADGYFLRDTHRALLFALQYEIGMADGTANGNFGPGTKSGLQTQANLGIGATNGSKFFVSLFHLALRVNGHSVSLSGTYTSTTATQVTQFQNFVKLPATGTATVQTWAGLLVSTGDPDRTGSGMDGVTTLTSARLTTLRNAGYEYFGRYLTNATDHIPDKDLKHGEAERILAAGGKLFPIFQTGGGQAPHFTYTRGQEVAEEAAAAAIAYRLPQNAVIYFSVDYDAYDWEVTDRVIPYFTGVNEVLSSFGRTFRVGIYGPRNVCKRVSALNLATVSFVSDMSTGYTGNLGQTMPTNWSFDQVQTITLGTGTGQIEIDKNIVSGRDAAISALAPATNVGNDPLIPADQRSSFAAAWIAHCNRWADSSNHAAIQNMNFESVKAYLVTHDALITQLAAQLGVYKAMVLTPLIWEGLAINVADGPADGYVRQYYAWRSGFGPAPSIVKDDSSTGPCQIFARTAILARNWAASQGLLSSRQYSANVWQDMWEVWQKLADDEAYNITTGMYVMMYYAATRTGVPATQMRNLTPSQVMNTLTGYNGDVLYGRKRMLLYFLIQRWHETFR